MSELPFSDEIKANKGERAPATTARLQTEQSSITVRERGCFIVNCELTSPSTDKRIAVLYSEPDISIPKLTASHIMSPVGPNSGIGGQHGFPRWADYHAFPLPDSSSGEKCIAFQAKRSDTGLSMVKVIELAGTSMSTEIATYNSHPEPEATSLGEHLYFNLKGEHSRGLTVDGKNNGIVLAPYSAAALKTTIGLL